MNRFLFLRAQKWLEAAEERPKLEALDKLFAGRASFHVSLEENFKGKSAQDLKGALAPDALFIKFESGSDSFNDAMQLKCAIYRSQTVGQGNPDDDSETYWIDFDGETYAFDHSRVRYIVSSAAPAQAPAPPNDRASTAATGLQASPRKRQRTTGAQRVASILLEGITLNLVDHDGHGMDHFVQCLTESCADKGLGSKRGSSQSRSQSEAGASMAAAARRGADGVMGKWLESMDAAVDMVERVSGGAGSVTDALNAFAKSQCDVVEEALHAPSQTSAEEAPPAEQPSGSAFEKAFESLEYQNHAERAKFLADFVSAQKDHEAAKHSALVHKIVNF